MSITINGGLTVNGGVTIKPLSSNLLNLDANNVLSYNPAHPFDYVLNTSTADTKNYVFNVDFAYGGIKINAVDGIQYLGFGNSLTNIISKIDIGDLVIIEHSGGTYAALTIDSTYFTPIPGYAYGGFEFVGENYSNGTDINVAQIRIVKNYGTLVNGLSFYNATTPKYFTNFPGDPDAYIQARNGVYFNGGNFTITSWVGINSYAVWSRVIDFGNGQDQDNVILAVTAETGGYPAFGTAAGIAITSDTQMPTETWTHLAATYINGTSTLYMNGIQVAQGAQPKPTNVTRTHCYIGKSNWAADAALDGALGKVQIWGSGMNGTEVLADFNATKTTYGIS